MDVQVSSAEPRETPSPISQAGKVIFQLRLPIGLLALIPATLFIHPKTWSELGGLLRIVAVFGILSGLCLRALAAAYAGAHTRSGNIEANQLASGGPYSFVRNPIYLGNFILGLGMVALLGDAWLLPLLVLTFIVLYGTIIPAEEKFLQHTFGKSYRDYCRHVPRLWPRITPWLHSCKNQPVWSRAFSEIWIGVLLFGIYSLLMQFAGRH